MIKVSFGEMPEDCDPELVLFEGIYVYKPAHDWWESEPSKSIRAYDGSTPIHPLVACDNCERRIRGTRFSRWDPEGGDHGEGDTRDLCQACFEASQEQGMQRFATAETIVLRRSPELERYIFQAKSLAINNSVYHQIDSNICRPKSEPWRLSCWRASATEARLAQIALTKIM